MAWRALSISGSGVAGPTRPVASWSISACGYAVTPSMTTPVTLTGRLGTSPPGPDGGGMMVPGVTDGPEGGRTRGTGDPCGTGLATDCAFTAGAATATPTNISEAATH